MIKEVVRRAIPLVFNLSGGYQADGATVALHIQTVRIASAFTQRVGMGRIGRVSKTARGAKR